MAIHLQTGCINYKITIWQRFYRRFETPFYSKLYISKRSIDHYKPIISPVICIQLVSNNSIELIYAIRLTNLIAHGKTIFWSKTKTLFEVIIMSYLNTKYLKWFYLSNIVLPFSEVLTWITNLMMVNLQEI